MIARSVWPLPVKSPVDDGGRRPRSTERERRRALERAVAVAQVHRVVVGSIPVGIGGGQVEDAVVGEISRDNRNGIARYEYPREITLGAWNVPSPLPSSTSRESP